MKVAVFSTKRYVRRFLEEANLWRRHELTFPNVVITGHQAFFTCEAMAAIAESTLANVAAFERGDTLANEVTPVRTMG